MIGIIVSTIKIVVLLGFLVFIHELGHFLVAKLCKVKVNEFAIGFGPIIFIKQGKETRYELRLIPLGGFVNMEGEESKSSEKGSYSQTSIPKKIAIVIAGGLVNIIFAILIYMGLQLSINNNITTTVESVTSGYSAELAGIQNGDTIKKVNGKKVNIKSDINEQVELANGNQVEVEFERAGELKKVYITPTKIEDDGRTRLVLGLMLKEAEKNIKNNIHYATIKTGKFILSIGENIKMLFRGKVTTDDLMGPVGISTVVAKTNGFQEFIYVLALISLSLGFTNLLPFPPLDGGKVVLLIIEAIRRKPVSEKVEQTINMVGFGILILLSLYVTCNDIIRIF